MHKKLFIPGPVEVNPDVLKVLSTPMIGHRLPEYTELHARVKAGAQKMLYTKNTIYLLTASGTGGMEAAVRNCVAEKVLHCICGEFGERWMEISKSNGKEAVPLRVDFGKAIKPDMVDKELDKGGYDAVCLTHSETSSGVMNPVCEIAEVIKKYPDVLFLIDMVSSMGGAKVEVDKLGIDVAVSSTQKGFALPPGFTVMPVSQRALDRAAKVPNRGYYFDFLVFKEFDAKNQTPTTPSIPHLFALAHQFEKMEKEGLENRWNRHLELARTCRAWAKSNGFGLFPEPGYEAITLTCIDNSAGKVNVAKMNEELAKRGYVISAGYGKLKDKTFRIAHMGDCTVQNLKDLLATIDEVRKNIQA